MRSPLASRPWLAVVLLASMFLGSCLAILHIEINNAWEVYIPQDATKDFYDEVREQFVEDTILLALFEGESLYDPEFLRAFDAAGAQIEQHHLVERVLSVTTLERIEGTVDGFSVGLLIDPEDADNYSPEELRQRVVNDRFAPGLIASRDGLALALLVRPIPVDQSFDRKRIRQVVEETVVEYGIDDHFTALGGEVAQDTELLFYMLLTVLIVLPCALLLGVSLLWWLFRRWKLLVFSVVAMLGALAPCVACIVLLNQPFNLSSVIIPALIPGLAVALMMHLSNAMLIAEKNGYRGAERIHRGVEVVWRPAFFTALTTAAGLLSLTASPLVAMRTLGIATALGTVLTFVIVMILIPPIMARWEKEAWGNAARGLEGLNSITRWASRIAIRHAGWCVAIAVSVFLITLPQIGRIVSDGDFYYWLTPSNSVVKGTRHIQDRLTGMNFMEVVFDGPERDSLLEPERLQAIRDFQDWLDAVPEIAYTVSMTDLLKEMHWAFNEEDPDFHALPDKRALIAQYLFIYDGRELWEMTGRDVERTRIVSTVSLTNAQDLGRVADHVREYLSTADFGDLEWELSGRGPLFAHQQELLREGQLRSIRLAFPLIFILLFLTWRHIPSTLLCMIPNIAPLAFIFVVMGAMDFWLDAATVITASVVVGVGVDDTIHFYNAYWERRRSGTNVVLALCRAIRQTGRALTGTTIVLSSMFLLLLSSGFRPTQHFGILATIGICVALIFDVVVLPAVIVLYHRYFGSLRKKKSSVPKKGRVTKPREGLSKAS